MSYSLNSWPPPRRSCTIKVFVPSSILKVEPTPLLKALTVWSLARACAIHRIEKLIIYRDEDRASYRRNSSFILKILHYLMTPPYLRRLVIPLDRDLRFVGALKPLALPTHPRKYSDVIGSLRVGLVEEVTSSYAKAFIGLKKRCLIDRSHGVRRGDLILLRIVSEDVEHYRCEIVENPPIYIGFKVAAYESIAKAFNEECRECIAIEFTREGRAPQALSEFLRDRSPRCLCLLFGSPTRDFSEIVHSMEEGSRSQIVPTLRINTAPYQGVRTIRTTEALYISLAVLNTILYDLRICV